jgi:type VI secretion system protein ImpL
MLKYIIAAIVLAALWAATIFLDLPTWIGIVGTVVVIAVVLTIVLVKWWRARRAAQQLENALAAQAAQHAKTARPDLQAEIAEVQAEFQKAIAALKASNVGGGKDALYKLPWYVIVGPPGAGKTTALKKSGLNFPYLSREGGGVRGIGGTRNCDWWLTNDGVLLDTAGRWTTEEDRDEWLGFLDLLRRYRSRKPLNGLVVAVSIDVLGGASEQEVIDLGRRIRGRVDEAMSQLQMSLPVYVLFTKCDLVPGFVETFEDLSKAERGQLWGFTTSITQKRDPATLFSERFAALGQALESRMVKRLGDERRLERREAVFAFPEQFAALGPRLTDFVATLFEENVFRETPLLRGCYFVSGTQEGRPIDRVMHRLADALGIPSAVPEQATAAEPKSYFLTDVFKNIVFPDSALAVRSAAEQRRQRTTAIAVSASILAVSVGLLTFPAIAWGRNVDLVERATEAVEATRTALAAPREDEGSPAPDAAFEPLRVIVEELDGYEESTPLLMTFGMFQGDALRPALRRHLAHQLREHAIQPMRNAGVGGLESFSQRYARSIEDAPSAGEHRQNYDRLKAELLLTRPTEANQPALEGEVQTFLAERLTSIWADGNEAAEPRARRLVDVYLAELSADDALPFRRDPALVQGVRNALARVAGEQIAIDSLIERFASRPPLSVRSMVGSTVPHIRGRREVRAAFTYDVWTTQVRPLLDQPVSALLGEAWVLGTVGRVETSEAERERQRLRVRSEYFARYIDEWREFIRGLYTVPPRGGNQAALSQLQDLTRGQPSPFHRLFQAVDRNVTLLEPVAEEAAPDESNTGQALTGLVEARLSKSKAGRVGLAALRDGREGGAAEGEGPEYIDEDQVKQAFAGFLRFGVAAPSEGGPSTTGRDVYEEQLLFVRDALQTHLDDPSDPAALTARLQQARTRTLGLIAEQEVGWRPAFEALLWPPIDGASMSFSEAAGLGAGRAWCNDVVAPYDRMLSGRYPFDPAGTDLAFSDFADFYRPGTGTLWTYFDQQLDNHVERQGDRFGFKQQLGRPAASVLQGSLLAFLQRSQIISRAFFPANGEDPVVEVDVRIRPTPGVATISFGLSGETFEYHNGPEQWHRFTWPGEDPSGGAVVELRGEGMHERLEQGGEWGLFHLIDRGSVTSRGGDRVFSVTWRLGSHGIDVTLDFRPTRSDSPFFEAGRQRSSLFGPLRASDARVPREIVTGRRICPSGG